MTGVWTDISPVPCKCSVRFTKYSLRLFTDGTDGDFGFGGLTVDLKKPGTIMVAALNSWWPDGQVWRSTDSGTTWSPLWAWASEYNRDRENRNLYYSWDTSLAPWLSSVVNGAQVGWMMEALVIDPFDSDHWLYGTGASIWGGHDLTNWDVKQKVTLKSLADGFEQTAVRALISPPTGPNLFSGVDDIGGFSHADLDKAPSSPFSNPTFVCTISLDYAGNKPNTLVRPPYAIMIFTLIGVQIRIGKTDWDYTTRKIALSSDSGASWSEFNGAALGVSGGSAVISADADTILWRDDGTNTVKYSHGAGAFIASTGVPSGAVIASDKKVRTSNGHTTRTNNVDRSIQNSTPRQNILPMFQMTEESRSLLQEPWVIPKRYPGSSSTGQRAAISGLPPTLASSTLATSQLASARSPDSLVHLVWPLVHRRVLAATQLCLPQRFTAG